MPTFTLPPKLKDRLTPYVRTWRHFRHKELSWVDTAYGESTFYSQFGEDIFLSSFFNDQSEGFYVDIGAYHPYHFSNTYALYKRGWHGINIEPNPDQFLRFPKARPRDTNLQNAISTIEGIVPFTCNGVFSGIDHDTHLFKSAESKKVEVSALPLCKILDQHLPVGQKIDFLSVDCEGHDLEVLKSNNWEKYRPRVVLVEDHGDNEEFSPNDLLTNLGYAYQCRLGLTKAFVLEG